MTFYVSIGSIQDAIDRYREARSADAPFAGIIKRLYQEGKCLREKPAPPDTSVFLSCEYESFTEKIRGLCYAFRYEDLFSDDEYDIVPENEEVTTASLFWGTETVQYQSDCFEIDYVLSGECRFQFLDETRILKPGDLCVTAPYSSRSIAPVTKSSFAVPILVREKAFERTFYTLLSDTEIMFRFFNALLKNPKAPNYLLFHTSGSYEVQMIIRQLFLERFFYDQYTNPSGIYWLSLLFMHVLRNYETFQQFSSYEKGHHYAPILQYIQKNRYSVRLNELSARFNYSVPYLSKLIREMTGLHFTELVLRQRMSDAAALLEETDSSIETIARKTGYSSADHFSRSFRKHFHVSPTTYRNQKRGPRDVSQKGKKSRTSG